MGEVDRKDELNGDLPKDPLERVGEVPVIGWGAVAMALLAVHFVREFLGER
jgi:hypothetical protein